MLRVECESCKAPYQIDERRVQDGMKMRCPKCKHTFVVRKPPGDSAASEPAQDADLPAARAPAADLPAVAAPKPASPPGSPPGKAAPPGLKPAAPAAKPPNAPLAQAAKAAPAGPAGRSPFDDLEGLDLPAVPLQQAGLPATVPNKAARGLAMPPGLNSASLPTRPEMPAAAPPVPAAPAFARAPQAGGFGEIDLPALASPSAGLPAVRPGAKAPPVPRAPGPAPGAAPAPIPAPAPPAFGADLPVPASPGRLGASGAAGADLPMPVRAPFADLPSPARGAGHVDLPAARDAFGSDLPSALQAGLPSPRGLSDLPSPAQAGLPSPAHAGLPVAAGVGLPMPAQVGLPATLDALPVVASSQNNLPSPVSDERLLPQRQGFGELDMGSSRNDMFGELELPIGGASLPPALGGLGLGSAPPAAGGFDFGGLDVGALGSLPAPPVSSPPGNVGYGEVDLGVGSIETPGLSLGSSPPPSMPPQSVNLGEVALPTQTAVPVAKAEVKAPSRVAPRLIGLAVTLVLLGGGALQATPVGAFGHVAILDATRAKEYAALAHAQAEQARPLLSLDTYAEARRAADQLAQLHDQKPRAKEVTVYASYVEYMHQLRFGIDAGRGSRVLGWAKEPPLKPELPYRNIAEAGRLALQGDLNGARALLLPLLGGGNPRALDAAAMLGEVELRARNWKAADTAFAQAGTDARASFGRARAAVGSGDLPMARQSLEATLKASPKHAGAYGLRAAILLEDGNVEEAERSVAIVLDGAAKDAASERERSVALALRGMLQFRAGHPGEARAAYEEALRLDPQNPGALVGQAEAYFADARFTEALSRFETAAKIDPASVDAVIGVAKTKLRLGQAKDAAAGLDAFRVGATPSMRLSLWRAKAAIANGDKATAEAEFKSALKLLVPARMDAVEAYVEYATFLAAQGRPEEAEQQLTEARSKLPATSVLDRATADINVSLGKYDAAVQNYQAALLKRPEDTETRFRLGSTYRKMAKFDLALAEFERVAAQDKEFPGLALERGLVYEQSGSEEKALAEFKGALDKAPNDLDLQLRVAAAYIGVGKPEDAIPMLERLMKQRNTSAEVYHYMGRAYLRQGGMQLVSALKYLHRAVELDPHHAEFHVYVAWAANESNPAQLPMARDAVNQALNIDRLNADAYWQRGVSARKSGAVEDAIKDLKRALELKPTRFEAHATLAECYETKNQEAAALEEWRRALAGNDKDPSWRYQYGRLLFERRQLREALPHLVYAANEGAKVNTRPGWLFKADFYAAEALRSAGNKADAITHYKNYLRLSGPSDPDRRDALQSIKALGGNLDE